MLYHLAGLVDCSVMDKELGSLYCLDKSMLPVSGDVGSVIPHADGGVTPAFCARAAGTTPSA